MATATLKVNKPSEAREYFRQKMAFTTGPVELDRLMNERPEDIVVIDVRAAEDYRQGHIPGAINIPKYEWGDTEALKAKGLDPNKQNMLYCYSIVCHLAATAAVHFADMGFPVMELDGGFRSWQEHDMRVER